MKISEMISGLNVISRIIADETIKIDYDLRRGIRHNYRIFMEEYKIYNEERKRILRAVEEQEKYEGEDKEQKLETEKIIAENAIVELLDKEIEIQYEKVPEECFKESELSLKMELELEFMILTDEKEKI